MIFPTVNFPRKLVVDDSLFYVRQGLANKVDVKVEITDINNVLVNTLASDDGAYLRSHSNDHGYGETDFELSYNELNWKFSNCSLVSFGAGFLVLGRLDEESLSGYVAVNYLEGRVLEFSRDQAASLYYYSGFFFARTRRKWTIYNSLAESVFEFAISRDGDEPTNMPDLYKFGGFVYLNVGGADGRGYLEKFSLTQKKPLERMGWNGYIGSAIYWADQVFFIDRQSLYKCGSDELESGAVLSPLPDEVKKGDVWLWGDSKFLYLISSASDGVYAYDAEGSLQTVIKIPEEWRFSGIAPEIHGGKNVVVLHPYDLSEWGSAAFLVWGAEDIPGNSIMNQESLELLSIDTVEGSEGLHGFRIVVKSYELEVAVRHAAHHLIRLVHKVAPGLINRGVKFDEKFNGVIQIVTVTPQPLLAGSLYSDYLIEFLRQIKAIPLAYKAGNSRNPLVLDIYWSQSPDVLGEFICSSGTAV